MNQVMTYPQFAMMLPSEVQQEGAYVLRFARDEADLERILRMRFNIFNLELGEGLDASYATEMDCDEFDECCHHLMVIEKESGEVVGTYRMQTCDMAAKAKGFYSDGEFDLSAFPDEIRNNSVEIGRACVTREHRNIRVLFMLWRGLGMYMRHNQKRYLFGCCSLTSQSPSEGHAVMNQLAEQNHLHPTLMVPVRSEYECYLNASGKGSLEPVHIPRLMKIYLNYQAKICSQPAMDRRFKTIDFLTIIDISVLPEQSLNFFSKQRS